MWVTVRTLVELLTRAGAHNDAAILYGAVTSADSGAPPSGTHADRLRQSAALLRQHLTTPNSAFVSEGASRWTAAGLFASRWKP